MPESKVRPGAAQKRKLRRLEQVTEVQREKERKGLPGERAWVPPLFIACLLVGVAWLVVANVAAASIPFMISLGQWNILIGMVLIAMSFILMTLWK
ncbi:MAG: cell division protein CrgA [Propionibacteriaceae bacterium]|nr:cell division protein CrgA [Propionibacteriaceae bacterium]